MKDLTSVSQDHVQIVKFHGDFDDDSSIVLTETDYFRRMAFNDPLDIKFQSDALSNSILFVGYGANDPNIRQILFNLNESWRRAGFQISRPRSFIFLRQPNIVQQEVLSRLGITAISEDTDDPDDALPNFLKRLKEAVAT